MNDDGPKRRFFAGNSLRQALVQAAGHFDVPPEEIAYTPIEKRHGFLKTRRKVVIEVDPDHPRRASGPARPASVDSARGPAPAARSVSGDQMAAPGPAPERRPEGPEREARPERRPRDEGPGRPHGSGERRERGGRWGDRGPRPEPRRAPEAAHGSGARPVERASAAGAEEGLITLPEIPRPPSERFPVATGPVAEAAQRGLQNLLAVAGLELSSHIHQGEGRLEIELAGDDAELCGGGEGELLRAIEHLLPRVVRTLAGEAMPCRVDCDNFHEIREERLRSLAQREADEVRRRGRPRTLEPMNPADRRIVHVTLADDPAVETESEGEGYFKRVTIRPA